MRKRAALQKIIDRPERIKAILPRFVNYVACHIISASRKIFNYGKVILRIRTHVKTQTNALICVCVELILLVLYL